MVTSATGTGKRPRPRTDTNIAATKPNCASGRRSASRKERGVGWILARSRRRLRRGLGAGAIVPWMSGLRYSARDTPDRPRCRALAARPSCDELLFHDAPAGSSARRSSQLWCACAPPHNHRTLVRLPLPLAGLATPFSLIRATTNLSEALQNETAGAFRHPLLPSDHDIWVSRIAPARPS